MKLVEEQIKNIKWEDMQKMLRDAIQNGDKEFITSVLPFLDEVYHDYFKDHFDSDLFKNRDIALFFAEEGYDVPKDLYENDEEMILAAVGSPGSMYRGFELASDKYLHDKKFVIQMISQIEDYVALKDLLENLYNEGNSPSTTVPAEVLEDGEIKQFIENRIQELIEEDKEQSELQQLANTKKELEIITSELRENIASAQKLLDSYEEILNGGKLKNSHEE